MIAASQTPLSVPQHSKLSEDAVAYWSGIISARARDEWTELDLVVAAQLARCQADIERESVALGDEGSVVMNQRGTQIMNPRHTVLMQLSQRQCALMRALRMGGKVAGDPRSEAGRRKIEAESRQLRDELAEDELLAT